MLALPEDEVVALTESMLADFAGRHLRYREGLLHNASLVRSHVAVARSSSRSNARCCSGQASPRSTPSRARRCATRAPCCTRTSPALVDGQVRVAVSLRAIGEGHISSDRLHQRARRARADMGVRAARSSRSWAAASSRASWRREHLRAVLDDHGPLDELSHTILAELPDQFSSLDLQAALSALPRDLLGRPGVQATIDLLRQLVASAYEVAFPDDIAPEPAGAAAVRGRGEQRHGGRAVRPLHRRGRQVEYRATYTAYDGKHIAPRLLTSPDLRAFAAHRLAGPAARNKGMALFPRLVGGRHLSLCRSDGESTSLASSPDGFVWGEPQLHCTNPPPPGRCCRSATAGRPSRPTTAGWC